MRHKSNRRTWPGVSLMAIGIAGLLLPAGIVRAAEYRRLPVKEYRDRMKGGWIGQIVGVTWGGPTEGKFRDVIMPADKMPPWKPELLNDAFGQDDLYVEMTFLRTLEEHGFDVSIRQAGIDFANSEYRLWCANNVGRSNLRDGIAPPDSSHPKFHRCVNDIDYQIEADFAGLICPGLPNTVIELGEKFGRLMNYGDGMYAGQFMGALYAEAFFESDPVRLVEVALKSIPAESQYAEMARDVLRWYRESPDDWEKTWHLCEAKYFKNPTYHRDCTDIIEVKINGAYVLIGLLYGKRDPDQTVIISCRCGKDSDCNPSSAAGVLFTSIGHAALPERFTKGLDQERKFSHTAYSFPGLLDVCEKLARQAVVRAGGKIEKNADGEEILMIPVQTVKPSALEKSWAPGPIANSRFTEEELARIRILGPKLGLKRFAPGWEIEDYEKGSDITLHREMGGRPNVYLSRPRGNKSCTLSRTIEIPANKQTTLTLDVGHDGKHPWTLRVTADDEELMKKVISPETAADGWVSVSVDLSKHAGRRATLKLIQSPGGDKPAGSAYWGRIAIESK